MPQLKISKNLVFDFIMSAKAVFELDRLNLRERFSQVEKFLAKYQKIWQLNVLANYPKPFENISASWLDYIQKASEQDLYKMSNFKCTGMGLPLATPKELKDVLYEIRDLCDFPFYFHDQALLTADPIYGQQINGLQLKKSHELRNLGPFVKDYADELSVESLVEVGGGKGYLSLAASGCRGHHVVIDQVGELLSKCQGYFYRWERNKDLRCVCCQIKDKFFQNECGVLSNSLIIGLHLCGNLTNDCLASVINYRNAGVVSLGCCYHRLEDHQQNLSGLCKLRYGSSEFRLGLAPYHYKSIETYRNNVIKNIYRFALFDIYAVSKGVVGTVQDLNDYEYPHHAEVLDFPGFLRLNSPKVSMPTSTEIMLSIFDSRSRALAIDMEKFEYVRRFFSRLVEVYLVLDRAIYLEQNGFEVALVQVFDGRISPRNLAIIGRNLS